MRLNNTPTASFSEEYTPKLGDAVLLVGSNEAGTVVGHAVYLNDAPSFRVRYVDGRRVDLVMTQTEQAPA